MTVKKLRVDGRTIRSDETYTGNQVIHLLEVSFENGYRRGKTENKQLINPKDAKEYLAINVNWNDEYGYTVDCDELVKVITALVNAIRSTLTEKRR